MRPILLAILCFGCGADEAGTADASTTPGDAAVQTDSAQPDATIPTEAWIEIGTGSRRFETLTAGQEVLVIEGIQGGYHVWGAFRGGGFSGTDARINFEMKLDGMVVANANYTEPELPRGDDGDYDYASVAVIYISNNEVGPSDGETMTLSVEVTTGDGVVLSDETTVVPDCCVLPTGMRVAPP